MKKVIFLFFIILAFNNLIASEKIGKHLKNYLELNKTNNPIKVWIYFTDKGENLNRYFLNPELVVSKVSLERRKKVLPQNQLIDFQDLPVNQNYINQIKNYVVELKHPSRWFNSISAVITSDQIYDLINFPFIKEIELVERFRKAPEPQTENEDNNQIQNDVNNLTGFNYGSSLTQNQQINVVAVHNTGNYGQGVRICLMDAGFNRLSHEAFQNMNIIATWDFVNNRPYVGDGQGGMGEGSHGTQTLSTIGGFKDGQLIGPAFGATYILAKTENTDSETPIEMDNWIRALEWADSIGVDVTSTSLGYLEFDPPYPSYNWTHMDGNTVPITIAADLAVKRGIVVVNSAGNEGYDATHNTLVAPADGDSVIAVGAVTSSGTRASFSSVGNTVDGRIKPDVMAMGSGVRVASPYSDNGYTSSSGTSFSCPLAAGVAALILSENPTLTPMQVRDAMRNTANNAASPNREYGWGILNALNAVNYFNINFSHTPPSDSANVNGPYRIAVKITSRLGIDPASVKLFWGRGTITDSIMMMEAPGDTFYAFIPGNGQSAVYKYYIQAKTADGQILKRLPKRAPQELLEFRVGSFASISVNSGWNLMSVPVQNSALTVNSVFNDATSSAYFYDGKYIAKDTLVPGYGFWLKFNSNKNYSISGTPLTGISIPVKAGWNLIGSLNTTIPVYSVASNPSGIIQTPFYGYNGGYFNSPQIEKGKGYWVKVSQNGYLILNSLLKNIQSEKPAFSDVPDKLIFIDNAENRTELFLKIQNFDGELPPLPPSNVFDVRFLNSKVYSENSEDFIRMQGVQFPLRINLSPKSELKLELFDPVTNQLIGKLMPGGSLIIDELKSDLLKIRIEKEHFTYQLFQNYPNPFNPSTTIRFQIPKATKVTLRLFNLVGEELITLVDEVKEPGVYNVKIDLSKFNGLSSGVLFYQLKTNEFISTKKMIYLK
jgi:subtilisin family serine protease